jgi:tetratricopeptide (TPR) repeat protein
MALTAARELWSHFRSRARTARRCLTKSALFAAVLAVTELLSGACRADAVKGEATFAASGGYARLVLKLAEDVNSEVTTAGSIIVIRFARPVDIPVDKLAELVPDYVSSARRDPDGSAIRLSLARRATINTMTAGERIFVDFLPDSWNGPPPSLPTEVVRELSERARAAERALRLQRAEALAKKRPPIRVGALVQPTFVRFVFETPDGVGVSSVLNDGKLTLAFGGALSFDLADAKVAAPPNVASINQRVEGDQTAVDITLVGDADVHSFREEKNYIIDVAFQQPDKKTPGSPTADASRGAKLPAPAPMMAAAGITAREAPAQPPPGETTPPASESVAQQAKIELKPNTAAKMPPAPEMAAAEPAAKPAVSEPAKSPEGPQTETPTAETPKAETSTAETPKTEAANPAPKPIMAASDPPPPAKAGSDAVLVSISRGSDGLRLVFSFGAPTPAASFRRGDSVWLVFDSTKPIDVEQIRANAGALIGDVIRLPLEKGQAIRIRLNRPQMQSLTSDDSETGVDWTLTFADKMLAPPLPLNVIRNIADPAHANVAVPLSNPGRLHRLIDPDAGDALLVVTAPPPMRGFVKRQDFVELSLLESAHGVAVHPNSDDVGVEVAADKIILGRPGGLTLSSAGVAAERAATAVRPIFDIDEWNKDQAGYFAARQDALMLAIAAAEPDQRAQARLDLARFYVARGMYPEAKAECEVILAGAGPKVEESVVRVVHAIASTVMGRPEQGLKDLASPAIGDNYDSQLWKGLAYAGQAKWADAREKFKNADFAIASLPLELQIIVTLEAMRASLEVRDYAGAARRRSELDVIGVPEATRPAVAVLRGRLAEALGHDKDALDEYKFAVNSSDRAAAAEAKLLDVVLRQKRGEINPAETLHQLETLAVVWRGDSVEVKTLQMMSRIYSDSGRFPESLAAARVATKLQPNSEASRLAQDEASALFTQLFLGSKGDDLPAIEALGMFYDFRELTPIGRRGDEMIRRLSDRLVGVDLLDQAAELLQYQVDHRLEGAARAQVAARLAMVYLTNRKPDRAIAALRSTRMADLAGELRQQRLLLEARALSDVGRHDLALEIIGNINGREAIRLRSDIYWASRQWRESSEQIELYYGERWRDSKPLKAAEKSDVLRAVVGYALADDTIGLARFREKYAGLMSGETDRLAFDTASRPGASNSAEFAAIAKMAASVDTLEGFLREMKTRFPDAVARETLPPGVQKADPDSTGSLPADRRIETGRGGALAVTQSRPCPRHRPAETATCGQNHAGGSPHHEQARQDPSRTRRDGEG